MTGGVQPGMVVKASGDIHVEGMVEGGSLISGGDIVVKGGIIGLTERRGETSRHSTITCKGSCGAAFAQNAHIAAGDDILIRDSAMQSELSAGRRIIVGEKDSRHGHLIGGVARARMLVKAQVIGSPGRSNTLVIVGPEQALHVRLDAVAEARRAATAKLVRVARLLELTEAEPGRLTARDVEAAETTRATLAAELALLELEEANLNSEITAGTDAQIVEQIVAEVFQEGVEVRFGSTCRPCDRRRRRHVPAHGRRARPGLSA